MAAARARTSVVRRTVTAPPATRASSATSSANSASTSSTSVKPARVAAAGRFNRKVECGSTRPNYAARDPHSHRLIALGTIRARWAGRSALVNVDLEIGEAGAIQSAGDLGLRRRHVAVVHEVLEPRNQDVEMQRGILERSGGRAGERTTHAG